MVRENNREQQIPRAEAEEQVRQALRRLAMLYHFTAEVLVDQCGSDKAAELLKEIICRYGIDIGAATRERVAAAGLALSAENFQVCSDLPALGWRSDSVIGEDGVPRMCITSCPLAETWLALGSEKFGRIYCMVDEVKYEAYNGSRCRHLKNVLDGDDCCLFDLKEKISDDGTGSAK